MSDALPNDPAALQALLLAERQRHQDEIKRLTLERDKARAKLEALLRQYFGRSSEKLDPNQLHLALEAAQADKILAEESSPVPSKPRAGSERRARRLEDLPVLETIYLDVPLEERTAPDGTAMVKIREEITDEVDYQPGKLYRRQIIRPVYASPDHRLSPKIAELPARVIPGSQVGPGLIAHVVLSKFCDHLPIHRQEQMLGRLGPTFSRQAMGQWIAHASLLLQSVHAELLREALAGRYIQMDETPIATLDPERPGRARDAWLWAVHAPEQRIVCFEFHKTRSHSPPKRLLEDFGGVLQTDGFSAYDTALRALPGNQIVRAACMAHARRGFMEALEAGDDRASPFLVHFGALYRVETEARGFDPGARAKMRSERSVSVLLQLFNRLRSMAADPAVLPHSSLGKAVQYCLNRWPQLCLFAEPAYGFVNIDSNPIERQIRPTKLGLRNWLFIGHPDAGDRPAIIYSIIATCKLHKVDPWAYLHWALPGLAAAKNSAAGDFAPARFLDR